MEKPVCWTRLTARFYFLFPQKAIHNDDCWALIYNLVGMTLSQEKRMLLHKNLPTLTIHALNRTFLASFVLIIASAYKLLSGSLFG